MEAKQTATNTGASDLLANSKKAANTPQLADPESADDFIWPEPLHPHSRALSPVHCAAPEGLGVKTRKQLAEEALQR